MNNSTKIIMALLSASIMLVGGGAMLLDNSDDSFASNGETIDVHFVVGQTVTYCGIMKDRISTTATVPTIPGISFSNHNTYTAISGTFEVTGIYFVYSLNNYGPDTRIIVSNDYPIPAVSSFQSLTYDSNPIPNVYTVNVLPGQQLLLKPLTFDTYGKPNTGWVLNENYTNKIFSSRGADWMNYIDPMLGNIKGVAPVYDSEFDFCIDYFHYSNPSEMFTLKFHIIVGNGNLADFTGVNLSPANGVSGINLSHKLVNETGVTITVSGANTSWIHVNGNQIYGVPPTVGDYTVTVQIVKDGYNTINETFTLTVVGLLVVTNSPLNGAYSWV